MKHNWQLIKTAPRIKGYRIIGWDGSEVVTLDYVGPTKIGINNHIDIEECWVQVSDSGRQSTYEPTHWMPLPNPPKE